MNKEYKDMKALGPSPTVAQIREVRKACYQPVIAQAAAEGYRMFRSERHKVDAALIELRNTMFADIYKNAKKGAIQKANAPGAGAGSENGVGGKAAPFRSQGAGRPGLPAGTGENKGADGAKKVDFGKEKKPTVDSDGIIQDR